MSAEICTDERSVSLSFLFISVGPMAKQLAEQIRAASRFFSSNGDLLEEQTRLQSMKAMVTSLCNQVAAVGSLALVDAPELNEAIAASSFPDGQKQLLATAVAQRCLTQVEDAPSKRRQTQTIQNILHYLTQSDWDAIRSGISQGQKVARVMDRMWLLGVRNPAEATVRSVAAAIASGHCPDASQADLHSLVLDVKGAAAARKNVPSSLPHIVVFPDDPADLPASLRQSAYTTEDPPVAHAVPDWLGLVSRVPLRKTNTAIAGRIPPGAAASSGDGDAMVSMMRFLMNHCQATARPSGPVVQILRAEQAAANSDGSIGSAPAALPALPAWLPPPASPVAAMPATGFQTPRHELQRSETVRSLDASASASKSPLSPLFSESGLLQPTPPHHQFGGQSPPASVGKALPASGGDCVALLEAMAAGGVGQECLSETARAATKQPAKGKAKATELVMRRPAAMRGVPVLTAVAATTSAPNTRKTGKQVEPARSISEQPAAKKFKLGCSKCRGSPGGCAQCKDPAFMGRRWQR